MVAMIRGDLPAVVVDLLPPATPSEAEHQQVPRRRRGSTRPIAEPDREIRSLTTLVREPVDTRSDLAFAAA